MAAPVQTGAAFSCGLEGRKKILLFFHKKKTLPATLLCQRPDRLARRQRD